MIAGDIFVDQRAELLGLAGEEMIGAAMMR